MNKLFLKLKSWFQPQPKKPAKTAKKPTNQQPFNFSHYRQIVKRLTKAIRQNERARRERRNHEQ